MFDLIHSVDSRKLLDEIDKVAAKHDKIQDVLLQVNVAREASKTDVYKRQIQNYIEKNAIKYDIIEIIFGRSVIWIFTH